MAQSLWLIKSHENLVIFHSYVSRPEGMKYHQLVLEINDLLVVISNW